VGKKRLSTRGKREGEDSTRKRRSFSSSRKKMYAIWQGKKRKALLSRERGRGGEESSSFPLVSA